MSAGFTFKRGQTILPTLEAVSGDPAQVDGISAKMRLTFAPHTVIPVTAQARGAAPAGWDMIISEVVSRALQVGMWQLDARLTIGSTVIVTDPVSINVVSSASAG